MKLEKKQLLIFLIVAFGISYLMMIPMSMIQKAGKDTTVFGLAQMFYPASGLILAKLICEKDKSLLPKRFFISFLILNLIALIWCFASFSMSYEIMILGQNNIVVFGSIIVGILYLTEKKEKRIFHGLKSKNWKMSIAVMLLFLVIYFAKAFVPSIISGEIIEMFEVYPLSQRISFMMILIPNFVLTFAPFFGEEYGWRCYFQPLIQKKYGLIKGVLIFGVLWGLWHLPLNLFYYAPTTGFIHLLGQIVTCMSLGVFFAFAYMKTNNLWLIVLLHYFNNNLIMVLSQNVSIANQVATFEMVGVHAIISFSIFLPFLFSKVFRKKIEI